MSLMMELDFTKPAPKPETLSACHALIDILWQFVQKFEKELDLLKIKIVRLEKENIDLKERLNLNSKNSSRLPSTDF